MEKNNQDIDLIITQDQFKQNQLKAIEQDKMLEQQKIDKQHIENIKVIITSSIMCLFLIGLLFLGSNLKQKGIDGCLENGYSYNYCVEHS